MIYQAQPSTYKLKRGYVSNGNEFDLCKLLYKWCITCTDEWYGNAKHLILSFQFLKKVQRQERVIEEVKLSLKPFYNKKTIGKDDYKEIMRKCVQKVRLKCDFLRQCV